MGKKSKGKGRSVRNAFGRLYRKARESSPSKAKTFDREADAIIKAKRLEPNSRDRMIAALYLKSSYLRFEPKNKKASKAENTYFGLLSATLRILEGLKRHPNGKAPYMEIVGMYNATSLILDHAQKPTQARKAIETAHEILKKNRGQTLYNQRRMQETIEEASKLLSETQKSLPKPTQDILQAIEKIAEEKLGKKAEKK